MVKLHNGRADYWHGGMDDYRRTHRTQQRLARANGTAYRNHLNAAHGGEPDGECPACIELAQAYIESNDPQ